MSPTAAAALLRLWVGLGLFCALAAPALSNGLWAVSRIEVAGAPVERAQIDITEPGARSASRVSVRRTSKFPAGTTIGVPEGTTIELESPNGERVRSGKPSGSVQLQSVGASSESYAVLAGRWFFTVLRRLDFFSVSTRTISAQTRATAFSVELDDKSGMARFAVEEGSILIRRPVLARIGQAQARLQASETLGAGAPARSYAVTPQGFLYEFGSYAEALGYFEGRLREADQAGDLDAGVDMLIALADTHTVLGHGDRALPLYSRALDIVRRQNDGYWQAVLLGRLGNASFQLGLADEAARHYRHSMELHALQPAMEGEFTVDEQAANLASAYLARGTYRCAAQFGSEVLARLQSRYAGANHPSIASLHGVLGGAAYALGDFASAARHHAQALEILRRLHAPLRRGDGLAYHEEVAQALNALGWDDTALRRHEQARQAHHDALTIAQALFAGAHVLQADARHGLANVLLGRGRAAAAVEEHQRALEIQQRSPPDAIRSGLGHLYLGEALLAAKRPQASVAQLLLARESLREKIADEIHPYFVDLFGGLARSYSAWPGHAEQAAAATARAREIAAKVQEREAACMK